jgi:hypothetical protein
MSGPAVLLHRVLTRRHQRARFYSALSALLFSYKASLVFLLPRLTKASISLYAVFI